MKASHSIPEQPITTSSGNRKVGLGKVLYGLLFSLLLPVGAFLWARQLDQYVTFPTPHSISAGAIVAGFGALFMLLGIAALWRFGQGLPMNPYPPAKFVSQGIYHLIPHPIYVGWSFLCGGIAVVFGSPGGFWIVTPVMMLGCAALVYGYERHDLDARFGTERPSPAISLPHAGDESPSWAERLSVYTLVLLPWLLTYELALFVGPPDIAWNLTSVFENRLPVIEWTVYIYASAYVWVGLAPLLLRSRTSLRDFAVSGLFATAVGVALFFLLPVQHMPRPFEAHTIAGQLLLLERQLDGSMATFPAFHFVWALLTMRAFSRSFPRLRVLWLAWALAIGATCITTGAHSLLDLVGAALVVWLVWQRHVLWSSILKTTEALANSWKEWHVGPVRIINHSFYAAAAAFVGLAIVTTLLPSIPMASVLLIALSGIAGGALYAQWIEGSSRLLRPFGYFGAVIGCCIGATLASLQAGADGFLLFSVLAIAAPFAQALGRLRCIVQGCCHGRATHSAGQGICCWHPSSRVVHLAELANKPIYPTPLYSIMWNLFVGLILLRLWTIAAPASLIIGLYFILAGLGRFVEEAYRGEPQTPIKGGLRLYQWWSIASAVVGIAVSAIPSTPVPASFGWNWQLLPVVLVGAILWGIALGVDFPKSHQRFARLTG